MVSIVTKKAPAGLKISKMLLQQEITKEHAVAMFNGEKTPKLDDFVSNRTKRKFSAFLLYDFKADRPTFEFPPREAKKKAAKKSARKTAKKAAKKPKSDS